MDSVAFSPTGTDLLATHRDGRARIWDAATSYQTGRTIRHFTRPPPERRLQPGESPLGIRAAFDPTGKRVVTGGGDRIARLWDVATGQQIGLEMPHESAVLDVGFDPAGARVITRTFRSVQSWICGKTETRKVGEPLRSIPRSPVIPAPLADWVLTRFEDHARLSRAAWTGPSGPSVGHHFAVESLAIHPFGGRVLTSGYEFFLVWDAATRELLGTHVFSESNGDTEKVHRVGFDAGGDRVAVVQSNDTLQWFDARTGEKQGMPASIGDRGEGHDFGMIVGLGPAGARALRSKLGPTRFWDLEALKPIGAELPGGSADVAFNRSAAGAVINQGSGAIRARNTTTGEPLGPTILDNAAGGALALSASGGLMLVGSSSDDAARLWSVAEGRMVGDPLWHLARVRSVAFDPTSALIATGCEDGSARLWDVATGLPLGVAFEHPAMGGRPRSLPVKQVAFTADGKFLLTGCDEDVRYWPVVLPVPDEPGRLRAWVEVRTRFRLDDLGIHRRLTMKEWRERWAQLDAVGGPCDPAFGLSTPELTDAYLRGQAAHAHVEKDWYAESLFQTDLIRRKPDDAVAFEARGDAYSELEWWARAAADFEALVRLKPDAIECYTWHGLAALAQGDHAASRRVFDRMRERFGANATPQTCDTIAFYGASVPGVDAAALVRLAEKAAAAAPDSPAYLETLGAALYRAGRFREAVDRLELCTRLDKDGGTAWTHLFLAMAHDRVGHAAPAADHRDAADKALKSQAGKSAWPNRLRQELLRREAAPPPAIP